MWAHRHNMGHVYSQISVYLEFIPVHPIPDILVEPPDFQKPAGWLHHIINSFITSVVRRTSLMMPSFCL